MLGKFPKDDARAAWTRHIKNKMMFYGLSEQRIRRLISAPARIEEGIAPDTIAVMQRNDRGKKKEEIWAMYKKITNDRQRTTSNEKLKAEEKSFEFNVVSSRAKLLMISAWRYPGVTKPGDPIPIPDEIISDLEEQGITYSKS
jgi:hypothetical protein